MLDSGHTIKEPGALGIRGEYEKTYNDLLVKELASLLAEEQGIDLFLSGVSASDISLKERVDLANQNSVDLLLSIHHNSVSEKKLELAVLNGSSIAKSKEPVSGYSIFVSQENKALTKSILFATELGQAMEQINRRAFDAKRSHELKPQQRLMNKRFSIYQFDHLGILRGANMPAILFEVGFIVDSVDEAFVSSKRSLIAKQIVKAINKYREHSLVRSESKQPA